MTTSSQAEINPETSAVLVHLNLSISRQDDFAMLPSGRGDSGGDASLISLTGLTVAWGLSRA